MTGGDPWAGLAATYEEWYASPLGGYVIAEEERALLSLLPSLPVRIVEIGAGTGWWSRRLAAGGHTVTAVEPSAAMRRMGEPLVPRLTWLDASGERLPLADGSADTVLLVTVLEFVADRPSVLREAWRVVAPGGSLVVGHIHPLSPWAALYRRLADDGVAPWQHARLVSGDALAAELGADPDARVACVHLAPGAEPPFEVADSAGRAAGNAGAFEVLRWTKRP